MTFRLADSAVVEPSSSYEEMSSPDLPVETQTSTGKANASVKSNGSKSRIEAVLSSEDIPWSWSKGPTSPIVEKGDTMNLVGDGEDADDDYDEEDVPLTMRSMNGNSHDTTMSSVLIGSAGKGFSFDEAPDGGSGVGFFELEEELHSASISPHRSPRSDRNRFGFFDDWGVVPDEDMDMDEDEDTSKVEMDMDTTEEEKIAKEMEAGDGEDDGVSTACAGSGIAAGPRKEDGNGETSSTFASGSVPIDIVVRPSSSWVGSFGAGSMARQSSFVP